jgi:2-polyprenyl-3-methyl-5-hydroxy-6-metoxy-1,4-benzoquinol methylase
MDAEYAEAYPTLYENHWWWRVREAILRAKIRAMLDRHPSARILDVGCGAGLFFDVLESFGHVEGIESDPGAIAGAGRRRSRITQGELDASFAPAEPFDLILALDVLEHVARPEAMLRRAWELLKPGGKILITVPAFEWLWTGHDDQNHHLRRYTAPQLQRALRGSGFAAVETRYLFQSLILPKLAVRAMETLTGRRGRVPRIPPPLLNDACRAWYSLEDALAWWLPFGGSVLAEARRSP